MTDDQKKTLCLLLPNVVPDSRLIVPRGKLPEQLQAEILPSDTTKILVAGQRGMGKTTELRRLTGFLQILVSFRFFSSLERSHRSHILGLFARWLKLCCCIPPRSWTLNPSSISKMGPLLAWRKTSLESLRRNFLWPTVATVATAVLLIVFGMRPWQDYVRFLFADGHLAFSAGDGDGDFGVIRGGRVIRETGHSLLASMVQLTRRNTRRYGGYIVHFAVVVMIIGIAGSAFNQQTKCLWVWATV